MDGMVCQDGILIYGYNELVIWVQFDWCCKNTFSNCIHCFRALTKRTQSKIGTKGNHRLSKSIVRRIILYTRGLDELIVCIRMNGMYNWWMRLNCWRRYFYYIEYIEYIYHITTVAGPTADRATAVVVSYYCRHTVVYKCNASQVALQRCFRGNQINDVVAL